VCARSEDGIIEAVSVDGATFGIGVQWHPEVTAERDARLFESLTRAAHNYRRSA